MSVVVCLSGSIGSGKSSVREALSNRLGWRHTAFGDYLRVELERLGKDPSSRKDLQDLGQARVELDPKGFCCDVLQAGGYVQGMNFLIDGVRHVAIFDILKELLQPSIVRLICLTADDQIRLARIAARSNEAADFDRANAHQVESETKDQIALVADLVVNTSRSLEDVIAECEKAISEWT